jgi:hypothetical protein
MIHENFFIRKNSPELIKILEDAGYRRSKYCNEGIYLFIEDGIIMQTYSPPYKKHTDFGVDEKKFIEYATTIS